MNIIDALQQRKSTRAFLDKPVDREQIVRILAAARHAPSGTNAQPWQVAVVSGRKKRELTAMLGEAFQREGPGAMDYQYYPVDWQEPYRSRRVACGAQLYAALGIDRRDRERRLAQWAENYRAFGAPMMLFFFLDPVMQQGSLLDYGMFVQSVMLAALEEGLATCPQAALGQYSHLIKDYLGYRRDTTLICGMAIGYEDRQAPVNGYRTPRAEVTAFTRFLAEDD